MTNVILCNTIIYVKLKNNLKTIRLTSQEQKKISQFLYEHPYIKEFSTLVRAAMWNFIQGASENALQSSTPSFLWEYDLTQGEIVEILHGPQKKRLWLVAKIMEHGKWDEIWEYLDIDIIRKDLPSLRLLPKTKKIWEEAISLWRY